MLTRKLAHFVPLSASEEDVIARLPARMEHLPSHVDIVTEGAGSLPVFVVMEGMAIRYRILPDGGRQIIAFLIPGDLCGGQPCLPAAMDHSISTLSPMRVAPILNATLQEAAARHPRISDALRWCSVQEGAILRERVVSLGRRDARGRIACLLCELLWRHRAVGLAEGDRFCLPLTQVELGDTLGLTPIHVNKILQEFRKQGLITMERKMLDVLDAGGLQAIAELDDAYLNPVQRQVTLCRA